MMITLTVPVATVAGMVLLPVVRLFLAGRSRHASGREYQSNISAWYRRTFVSRVVCPLVLRAAKTARTADWFRFYPCSLHFIGDCALTHA